MPEPKLNYNLGKLPEMLQLPFEVDFLQNQSQGKNYNNKIMILKKEHYIISTLIL